MAKKIEKPYWEMNLEELREATKEFDEDFVFEKTKPLSAKDRAWWKRMQAEVKPKRDEISFRACVDKKLFDRCKVLAKKKRISLDQLVARGFKAVLAAEGE